MKFAINAAPVLEHKTRAHCREAFITNTNTMYLQQVLAVRAVLVGRTAAMEAFK